MKTFTKETLAKFDGKDGHAAYIAVNGKVYDVSANSHWNNGQHHGFEAGKDLTKEILTSPHGKAVLTRIPEVGTYEA